MSEPFIRPERIRRIRSGCARQGPVVYWMSRDQRVADNWALLHAQQRAMSSHAPLLVAFCLVPDFMHAAKRQYAFMLKSLRQISTRLNEKEIPFRLLAGSPLKTLPDFLRGVSASLLVADFDPTREKIRWIESVGRRINIPFEQVDAHNIVPCWTTSPKQEWAACTLRPKLQRLLSSFLNEFPRLKKHPFPWPGEMVCTNWAQALSFVRAAGASGGLTRFNPGEREAASTLNRFIKNGLPLYRRNRNNPVLGGQSGLSPYLHFGHISAQRIALEITSRAEPDANADAFLEELIVRRELSDNFCFYNGRYDSFEGFPDWAKNTLLQHALDPRPAVVTFRELEQGETRDPMWNAAQMEMVKTGKMHGYMRMYWAKKILEWSPRPEEALETALVLNDKYELDGCDPNGAAGCAWSIGGVHDRAWGERPVFGKIRAMCAGGLESKMDARGYIKKIQDL